MTVLELEHSEAANLKLPSNSAAKLLTLLESSRKMSRVKIPPITSSGSCLSDQAAWTAKKDSKSNFGKRSHSKMVLIRDVAEDIPERNDRYDKLKKWETVQKQIRSAILERYREEMISLSTDMEPLNSMSHSGPIRCMLHVPGKAGQMFLTHSMRGSVPVNTSWIIPKGSFEVKLEVREAPTKMKEIYSIKPYRAIAAFCADMTLKIFSDLTGNCIELASTPCRYPISCICYVSESDELLVGGLGCLLRYSMTNYRKDGLRYCGTFKNIILQDNEHVISLRQDEKTSNLLIVTDSNVYIISTVDNSVVSHLQNCHRGRLTCTTYYPARDYFITGSNDGTIKIWYMFQLFHELNGHTNQVTCMAIHPTSPLLLSCSIDCSIRVWRLDILEMQQCVDMKEPLYDMRILGPTELVYWTETGSHHCSMNFFFQLFTKVQSEVRKLSCWKTVSGSNRILACVDDGSIRIISSASGSTITVVYPLMTNIVPTLVLYDSECNHLFEVQMGSVMVYDCTTNPCQVAYRLESHSRFDYFSPVACIAITKWSPVSANNQADRPESLIFAGHNDGRISLLHAKTVSMEKPIKAHQSPVVLLEGASPTVGIALASRTRPPVPPDPVYIISSGSDDHIRVWEVYSLPHLPHVPQVSLRLAASINYGATLPGGICMMGPVLCTTTPQNGKVRFYRLNGAEAYEDVHVSKGAIALEHSSVDDHALGVNDVACCPCLQLFATSSMDWTIKIWNIAGQLFRELIFNDVVYGLTFANVRGDIVVGYRKHIYCVEIVDYLLSDTLENLVNLKFQDEPEEDNIGFDHTVRPQATDCKSYPCDLKLRRQILKKEKQENSLIARDKSKLQSIYDKYISACNIRAEKNAYINVLAANRLSENPGLVRHQLIGSSSDYMSDYQSSVKSDISILGTSTSGYYSSASVISDEFAFIPGSRHKIQASQQALRLSCHQLKPSTSKYHKAFGDENSLCESHIEERDSELSDQDSDEELSSEIITDEGIMGPQRKKTMKIGKSKAASARKKGGKKRISEVVDVVKTHKEEDVLKDEKDKEKEEEEKKKKQEEKKKKYPIAPDGYIPNSVIRQIIRPPPEVARKPSEPWRLKPLPPMPARLDTVHHSDKDLPHHIADKHVTLYLSDTSMSNPREEEEKEQEQVTAVAQQEDFSRESTIVPIAKKGDFVGLGYDKTIPEIPEPIVTKAISEQLSEHAPSTISEDDDDDGVHKLVKRIVAEDWFDDKTVVNVDGVVDGFLAIMDDVLIEEHNNICQYIVEIHQHQELSCSRSHVNNIVQKLLGQLPNPNSDIRKQAVECLANLGYDWNQIIMGVMPLLTDATEDVRKAAEMAMLKLTGVADKAALFQLLQDMGLISCMSSKEHEDETFKMLEENMTGGTDVIGLPKADDDDRIVIWLKDAKTVEKDHTGLYLEDIAAKSLDSPRRHKSEKTRMSSQTGSFKSSLAEALKESHSEKTKKPKKTLDVPVYEKDEAVLTSVTPTGGSSAVVPGRMLKIYDSQKRAAVASSALKEVTSAKTEKLNTILDEEDEAENDEAENDEAEKEEAEKEEAEKDVAYSMILDKMCTTDNSLRRAYLTSSELSLKVTRFVDDTIQKALTEENSSIGPEDLSQPLDKTVYPGVVQRGRTHLSPVLGSDSGSHKEADTGRDQPTAKIDTGIYHTTAEIDTGIDPTTAEIDTENWRAFFEHTKNQRELSHKEPISLPPIHYMSEDAELIPGEPGMRILHNITVNPKRVGSAGSGASSTSHRHRIHPLPAKLGVITANQNSGYSKYGILRMQWTTGAPENVCQRYLAHCNSHHKQPVMESHLNQAKFQTLHFDLDSDVESSASGSNTKFLPALAAEEIPYEWARPLPPLPPSRDNRGSQFHIPAHPSHKHDCDYYRLLKKRMHHHVSEADPNITRLPRLMNGTSKVNEGRTSKVNEGHTSKVNEGRTSKVNEVYKPRTSIPSSVCSLYDDILQLPHLSWRTVILSSNI